MKLKFIGEDGSMGLKHGEVYDITIFTESNKLVVRLGPHRYCPYSSPQALADNWTKADAVEVVRCKDCKFYELKYYPDGIQRMCCENNKSIWTATPPDAFCSYGERRTDHGR